MLCYNLYVCSVLYNEMFVKYLLNKCLMFSNLCLTLFVLCMQEVMLLSLHSRKAKNLRRILKVNTIDKI